MFRPFPTLAQGGYRAGRALAVFALVTLAPLGCSKEEHKAGGDRPPPEPSASAGPTASPCANGGGEVNDPVSANFFPRTAGNYCLDPEGEAKTYGEKGKYSMDDVCTKAFDGECEVYKSFGLKRVVTTRYLDGSGKPNSVEVILSQFPDPAGAYGMFTKRVVADGDPANASTKPLAAGAAGAMGKSNAYVWKGPYLVELTFVSEDTKATADQIASWSSGAIGSIAKGMGDRLPGANELPAAAKTLPAQHMVPLGISFVPKDAFGVAGFGPVAIGFYKDGNQRYRLVSAAYDDADKAKDALKALKGKPGALPVKDVGDEGIVVVLQEGAERPKVEYVIARKGGQIAGVGDEDLVEGAKLSKDDKIKKLKEWLAGAPAPAAGSAAPAK